MKQSVQNALFVDWLRVTIGLEPISRPGAGNLKARPRPYVPEVVGDGNRRVGVGGARFAWRSAPWAP